MNYRFRNFLSVLIQQVDGSTATIRGDSRLESRFLTHLWQVTASMRDMWQCFHWSAGSAQWCSCRRLRVTAPRLLTGPASPGRPWVVSEIQYELLASADAPEMGVIGVASLASTVGTVPLPVYEGTCTTRSNACIFLEASGIVSSSGPLIALLMLRR